MSCMLFTKKKRVFMESNISFLLMYLEIKERERDTLLGDTNLVLCPYFWGKWDHSIGHHHLGGCSRVF